MNEVHKLTDHLLPGEADHDLVEALEDLLAQAKRGEIKAAAWIGITGNDAILTDWTGPGGTIFSLGSGVLVLQARYAQFIREYDD